MWQACLWYVSSADQKQNRNANSSRLNMPFNFHETLKRQKVISHYIFKMKPLVYLSHQEHFSSKFSLTATTCALFINSMLLQKPHSLPRIHRIQWGCRHKSRPLTAVSRAWAFNLLFQSLKTRNTDFSVSHYYFYKRWIMSNIIKRCNLISHY